MNSTPDDPKPGFLVALARVLGRSRTGQFVGAMLVASVSAGTAYLVWRNREFAGLILTMAVLDYGFRKAWEFLPIPVGMRQSWARWKDLYNLLILGGFLLIMYCSPGPFWRGWSFVAFSFLGAALASITTFLARLADPDRRETPPQP
jgi:hypothetical protein